MPTQPTRLASTARRIATAHGEHFDPTTAAVRQVLAVTEAAGKFVGAYRRATSLARRPGAHAELRADLADVVIAAYVAAVTLDIDLDQAIAEQLTTQIPTPGWHQPIGGDAA